MAIVVIATKLNRLVKRPIDSVAAFFADDKYIQCVFDDGEVWFVNRLSDMHGGYSNPAGRTSLRLISDFLKANNEHRFTQVERGVLADLNKALSYGDTPPDSALISAKCLDYPNGVCLPVARRYQSATRKVFLEGVACV